MSSIITKALEDVAERVCVGYVGPSSEYFCTDGVPFLRTGNVGKRILYLDDFKRVVPEFHAKQKKSTLRTGDVVVTRVVSDEINAAVIPESLDGGNCGNIIVIRPGAELNSSYLVHLLSSPESQRILMMRQVGSAQSVINTGVLKTWQIPILAIEKQRRIAAILDQADALRAKRREALAQLDSLTQSIFIEMFGDPDTNQKQLKKLPLSELLKFKSGDFLPATAMAEDGIYPVFGGNGVNGHHDQFMFAGPKIIVGRVGVYCGCIHVSPEKSWITDNALYVSEINSQLNFYYLAFSLKQARLNQFASQSAQPLISGARLYPVEILVPPIGKQQEFTAITAGVEKLKARHLAAIAELDTLFASLQHRAFRGEL